MESHINLSEIESWEYIDGVDFVYDFEVEEEHCYYIHAGCPILVHNSGKTYSAIDFIIYLCLFEPHPVTINIIKETYQEFKTTLYDDFRERLDYYDLPNPFYKQDVHSFRINRSKTNLIGADKTGKDNKFHGAACDFLYINESLSVAQAVFDQSEMRCRKFWFMDYNPSVTEHYVFKNVVTRPEVGLLRTTFNDNPFVSIPERNKILSYEPWLPGSYTVEKNEIWYDGKIVDEKNQPPAHPTNVNNGTADEFMWKVYGLGLRGAMKGVIFKNVFWIDELPQMAYTYGMDFGFTCLSGDTMITTNNGQIRISDIKIGDQVLTRKGFRSVLNVFDNGLKEVITKKVGFDFGFKEITATFEHNFNVNGEWKNFGKLEKQETLCILPYLMEENSGGIQKERTRNTFLEGGKKMVCNITKGFISRYINFIKVKFQKACKYIILILMLSIMIFPICFAYLLRNTLRFIIHLPILLKLIKAKFIIKKSDTAKKTGIKEGKKFQNLFQKKSEIVIHAILNIHQQILTRSFAHKNAIINGNILTNLIKLKCSAKTAILNSWVINTSNPKHAHLSAHMNYHQVQELVEIRREFQQVYDLQVEDVHEYFANGILVHNCDPTAIGRACEDENNIYAELLFYAPIDNPYEIDATFTALGMEKHIPITADSSDKYINHTGSYEMVCALYDMGWEISKVSKTNSVMFWLTSMKRKKIHIVRPKNEALYQAVKKEVENYRFKEVNGILINQPIDKFNHFWDQLRYNHMSHASNYDVDEY
jgi:hypothetical protein